MKQTINSKLTIALICIISITQPAFGRSEHNWFNPVSSDQFRPLTTDRPDQTESPITTDPGHIQVETDIISYSYDKHNTDFSDTRVTSYSVGATNFRIGLLSDVELDIIIEPYVSTETDNRATGSKVTNSGNGDITLRSKINFWGNDGGDSAMAALPYIKLPTNSDNVGNDHVEGGIIFPYGTDLSDAVGLGVQAGVDFVRNDPGSGSDYSTNFIYSAAFGIDLGNNWGVYVETFNELSSEGGEHSLASFFDFGATYLVNENFQIDVGTNWGITRAADDFNGFIGTTCRW